MGAAPFNTPAVLKALADECTTGIFFSIGKHATYHRQIRFLDTLLVHRPTGSTQQRRDRAISLAAILTGKLDDVGN